MSRNITITFDDGSSHVYQNAPDTLTPDQVQARAESDFGKKVSGIDGGNTKSPVPEQQPNPVQRAVKNVLVGNPADNPIVKSLFGSFWGPAEAATQAVTGTVGAAAGGLRGLYGLATGDTLDQAANTVKSTQDALTYQPRTQMGRDVSALANAPIEYQNKTFGALGGRIGQAINGPQGQVAGEAIGQAVLPVATTIMGGASALKGASNMAAANAAAKTDAAYQAAIQSGNDAAKLDNLATARNLNLTVNPALTNPSFGNRLGSAVTGNTALNEGAYKLNRPQVNSLVRQDLGIPEGTALTPEAYNGVKQGFVDVSKEVQAIPKFKTDPEYLDNLNNRSFITSLPEEEQALLKNSDQVNALVDQAALPEITGSGAVAIMRELRAKSSRVLNNPQADPAALALADAQRNVAKQIESMIQRRLTDMGNEDLANRFAQQRTLYAKAKTYENATTANGDVNILKLRNNKGHTSFTGNLADLYDMSNAFPEAFTPPSTSGRGLNLTLGGRLNTALDIATHPLQSRMLSRPYQNKYASPLDARPLRQQLGYEQPGLLTGEQQP